MDKWLVRAECELANEHINESIESVWEAIDEQTEYGNIKGVENLQAKLVSLKENYKKNEEIIKIYSKF